MELRPAGCHHHLRWDVPPELYLNVEFVMIAEGSKVRHIPVYQMYTGVPGSPRY